MGSQGALASLVVKNARIYTVDPNLPWASAFAVSGGRFVSVGSDSEIEVMIGPDTEVLDAQGRLILPGLFDCHSHAFEAARADLFEVRLDPSFTFERILDEVRAAVKRAPANRWLKGAGWSMRDLIDQMSAKPSLQQFDEVRHAPSSFGPV